MRSTLLCGVGGLQRQTAAGTEGFSLRIILAGRILDGEFSCFTSTFAVGPQRWALDPGALRPFIDSYVADPASRGYEAATIHHLEHSARHFCYWLNHSGIAVSQTDDHVIKRRSSGASSKHPTNSWRCSRRLAKAGNYVKCQPRVSAAIRRWRPPTPHNNVLRILQDRKVETSTLAPNTPL